MSSGLSHQNLVWAIISLFRSSRDSFDSAWVRGRYMQADKEVMYLCVIMERLGFTQRESTELFEDSSVVIFMTENPVNHKVSRHIDTRSHYNIGELVGMGQVTLTSCRSDKMVTDVVTKGLSVPVFERHKTEMLGSQCVVTTVVFKFQVG